MPTSEMLEALEAILKESDFDEDDGAMDLGDRLSAIETLAEAAIARARQLSQTYDIPDVERVIQELVDALLAARHALEPCYGGMADDNPLMKMIDAALLSAAYAIIEDDDE